jgi:hypothetical protein
MSGSALSYTTAGVAIPALLTQGEKRQENFSVEISPQPIDKSRFGRENPRKSKEIQPS